MKPLNLFTTCSLSIFLLFGSTIVQAEPCTKELPCSTRSFSSLKEIQKPISNQISKLIRQKLEKKKSKKWKVVKSLLNDEMVSLIINLAYNDVVDVLDPIYKKLSMNGKVDIISVFKGNKKIIGRLVINTLKKTLAKSENEQLKTLVTVASVVLEPFIYDLVPDVGILLKNKGF